ncbi:MAG: hypothetical protein HOJ35_01875, partial [Bdellovibrionales bacterium]|nr:hypothetical protein [Bdellovibrionales bacterium]
MPKTKTFFLLSKYIKYLLIILSIGVLSSCLKKDDQTGKSSKSTTKSSKNKNIEINNTFALVMRGDHQNEGHCFDLKYSIDSEGEKSCQESPEGRCISKQFFSEEACINNPDLNLKWENGNCYASNYQTRNKCEVEGYCKVTYFENKQDCLKNKLDWKNSNCIDSDILTPDQCISDKDITKKWSSSYSWTHKWAIKESLTWENGKCEDKAYKTQTTCKAKGYCSDLSIKMKSQCLRQEKKCISKLYKTGISCLENGYKWEEEKCINPSRNSDLLCSEDNNFYWGPYDWVSNIYGNQELFYGPIVGEVKSEKIIPPVKIKWETIIDDKVVFSGYGGWISSKWPDNSFEGLWSINRIKLVDSVTNKIVIKVLDGSGNYEQTELKIEVDASPPDITIFNPIPVTQGAIFWTKNSKIPITGESIDNVQNKELTIYNRSIDDLNQEVHTNDNKDSNDIGKIINIRSNNEDIEIDLLPLINIIEIIGIDSSGNQSSKLIKIGKDTEKPSLQLKYPKTAAGNYTNRVVTSSPEDIRIEGVVEDVGSGIDYIKWKNLNTNQEGVINTIGEWKIEDIEIEKGKNDIEIIAVDKVGNHSNKSTHTHIFDDTRPEINSITINEDYPTTTSQYVNIFVNTIDHHSEIKNICLKYNNNTQPLSSDQCWTNTGDITDNKIHTNYQIGISAIKYKVYAWVKDEAGNISTLKNNGKGMS